MNRHLRLHFFYVIVIITLVIIFIKYKSIGNKNYLPLDSQRGNFFIYDSLTVLTSKVLKPNSYIGVISETDCGTCYEILLTRLNALKLNNLITDSIYVMLVKYNSDEFKDILSTRYRLQIPIITPLIATNSLLKKLKTPYLLRTDQNGNINSILQIDIDNINFVLKYFDGLRPEKFIQY